MLRTLYSAGYGRNSEGNSLTQKGDIKLAKEINKRRIENPRVLSETVEYIGGGCDILFFEVEVLEDGERSVFFVCEDPEDTAGIVWRRITVLDCGACEDQSRGWLSVPEASLNNCPGMKEILEDLHDETRNVLSGCCKYSGYRKKYPERIFPYKKDAHYQRSGGEYYGSLFHYVEMGKVRLYGFRDYRGKKGIDYDSPRFLVEYFTDNRRAAEDVWQHIERTTRLFEAKKEQQ